MTKHQIYRQAGRWSGLATVLFAAIPGRASADQTNTPPVVDPALLQKLIQRVDAQDAEIKQLKAQVASQSQIQTSPDMPPPPAYPTLQFHGFGDIDYHAASRIGNNNASGVPFNPPADHAGNSFFIGEFDLFLQSQIAEDLSVLNETVIGAGASDNEWGLDIERIELQWKPSEYFNVDLGRFHTEMGYYNTAYHHGTWFQNAVGRPGFLEYEDSGGLIPVHSVGISIHGAIPSGGLNLMYFVEVGNGRNYTTSGNPVQNVTDGNNYKAVNVALVAKPDWFPGGQFGVGAYHDFLTPQGLSRTDEWIWNAHVVYHSSVWELMAEGFLLRHESGGADHYTPMFYVQAARKFGKFTPYARFTYYNASRNDLIYTTILNQGGVHYGPSAGLRYDFSTYLALKAQYDYELDSGYKGANELTLQAAFTF